MAERYETLYTQPDSYLVGRIFLMVDRVHSDLPPAQPSFDEKPTNNLVPAGRATIQPSNQPRIRRLEYNRMKLNSRKAHGWVTEAAPEPEVVLHLDDPFSKGDMNAAPNGKWMAISFPTGITTVWNLENMSTTQIGFPHSKGYRRLSWSLDSRHLACFGAFGLEIWSTESQPGKIYISERVVTVAWFSNGEDLIIFSSKRVSIVNINSGLRQLGSDLASNDDDRPSIEMATIPVDRVGGRSQLAFHTAKGRPNTRSASVYDTDTQKTLARTQDESISSLAASKNGEFLLASYSRDYLKLWRLTIPNSDKGVWDIQVTLKFSFSSYLWEDAGLPQFGGENDEWILMLPIKETSLSGTQSPPNPAKFSRLCQIPANGPRQTITGRGRKVCPM
ncbi:hypothetical protein FRC01_002941 [Tulasnella sp. 417]|nr:hypothetical protein FRC01_002941 [Tulasnella sp. 417]